jgi:hypothetical protein
MVKLIMCAKKNITIALSICYMFSEQHLLKITATQQRVITVFKIFTTV